MPIATRRVGRQVLPTISRFRLGIALLWAIAVLQVNDALAQTSQQKNVLLIIADDLGTDALDFYRHPDGMQISEPLRTPFLSGLAKAGIVYDRVWAYPTCSPTRAAMLTGQFAFRTGVGFAVTPVSPPRQQLAQEVRTLPELFRSKGFPHALASIGKWHVSNGDSDPNLQGWEHFSGIIGGVPRSYTLWRKVVNGAVSPEEKAYITTDQANDAISFIQEQQTKGRPWFVWLGLTAPHDPFHVPPIALHDESALPEDDASIDRDPHPYFRAMVQAMDREIARVVNSVDRENTYIIFVGDNGTFGPAIRAPNDAAKGKQTLYEGGIKVPLIVSGPDVPAGVRSPALAHTTDLFSTIFQLAGASPDAVAEVSASVDSKSIVPTFSGQEHRRFLYSEQFATGGLPDFAKIDLVKLHEEAREIVRMARKYLKYPTVFGRTVTDGRFKLIESHDGKRELFDLQDDPWERRNLLDDKLDAAAETAVLGLQRHLAGLKANAK